ncbi:MAG: hypothetical protein WBA89_14345 [Microcoleus sp.]
MSICQQSTASRGGAPVPALLTVNTQQSTANYQLAVSYFTTN